MNYWINHQSANVDLLSKFGKSIQKKLLKTKKKTRKGSELENNLTYLFPLIVAEGGTKLRKEGKVIFIIGGFFL